MLVNDSVRFQDLFLKLPCLARPELTTGPILGLRPGVQTVRAAAHRVEIVCPPAAPSRFMSLVVLATIAWQQRYQVVGVASRTIVGLGSQGYRLKGAGPRLSARIRLQVNAVADGISRPQKHSYHWSGLPWRQRYQVVGVVSRTIVGLGSQGYCFWRADHILT